MGYQKIGIFVFCFWYICAQAGTIIILNGPSSAGKSSVSKHLGILMPHSYVLSYDQFRKEFLVPRAQALGILPTDYVFKNILSFFIDVRGAIAKNENSKVLMESWELCTASIDERFYLRAEEYAQLYDFVIVDATILKDSQNDCIARLGSVVSVFLHVPLKSLVERICRRNLSEEAEFRFVNRTLNYYPFHYKIEHKKDKSCLEQLSIDDIEQVVMQGHSQDQTPSCPLGTDLIEHIAETLQLSSPVQGFLAPKFSHHIVIDTSLYAIDEVATLIHEQLLSATCER